MNRIDAIRSHLEQAIEHAPGFTAPRYYLGLQMLAVDLLPAAQQAFADTILSATARANNLVQAATNCRQTNDFGKARQYLQKMIDENKLAANANCQLGTIALDQGNSKTAREQFSSAVEFDPTCAMAYFELGQLEQAAGMLLLAREHYYKAIDHEFTLADAHLQLSVVITAEDEFELAQNHYLIALDLEPGLEQPGLNVRFNNIR